MKNSQETLYNSYSDVCLSDKYDELDWTLFNRNRTAKRLAYCQPPLVRGFLSLIVDIMPTIEEDEKISPKF